MKNIRSLWHFIFCRLLNNLCTEVEQQKWIDAGLYKDPSPLVQAALVFSTIRPVLVLDINQAVRSWRSLLTSILQFIASQFIPWIKELYGEKPGIEIIQAKTKEFYQTFDSLVETKKKIIVIHTPLEPFDFQTLTMLKNPKVDKQSFKPCSIDRNMKLTWIKFITMQAISKLNDIFFITESSQHIPPRLRMSVTVISFAVSPRVLEEQLLK